MESLPGGPSRIADVAAHAGVGVATVSRVLNGRGSVSPDTRARVLESIRVLDYSPSSVARNLSLRRTLVIGVVVPFFTSPSSVERVRGVVAALEGSPYDLALFDARRVDDDAWAGRRARDLLGRRRRARRRGGRRRGRRARGGRTRRRRSSTRRRTARGRRRALERCRRRRARARPTDGLVKNGTTTPMTSVRRSERFRAMELGRYSSARIASNARAFRRDVAAPVQDARDRRDAHAGVGGDVRDPGPGLLEAIPWRPSQLCAINFFASRRKS